MPKLTPQEAREKYARRLKGSLEDVRRGVERVSEAPGVKAAAKVDKLRERWLQAIESGKWQRRVASVSLEEWRRLMLQKGVPRIAQGVDEASQKMEKFFQALFEHQERLQREIENMPDLTLEDSIQRMVAWVRGMANFRYE